MKYTEREVSVIDRETGQELKNVISKSFTVEVKQDQFYMIYFEQLSSFYKLTSIKEVFILAKMCSNASWDTGEVIISSVVRSEMMRELEIDKTYLSRCITRLCDKELLFKIAPNHYGINPRCFWKGSNATRNRLLKSNKLSININFELAKDDTNT